jgi:hypothetical protein
MRDFGTGFYGFNESHLNMIHLNNKKVSRILSELEIYKGILPIAGKEYKIFAATSDTSLNEVAHHIINKFDCEICMILNLKTKRVSFRKNKDKIPELDLGKLAQTIAEGGGHVNSSGGQVTDKVITITKLLQPV